MKLLSLRLCEHDSNIALYNDGIISYLKTERVKQLKHHGYNNFYEWKDDLKTYFGVDVKDIDEISIVLSHSPNISNPKPFVYSKTDVLDVDCPVYKIEHHYAHALSAWMFDDTEYQIVMDGMGEHYDNGKGCIWSIYKDYELIHAEYSPSLQKSYNLLHKYGYPSLGSLNDAVADALGIEGMSLDVSGKLMSLQSFGSFDYEFYEKNIRHKTIFDMLKVFDPDIWIKHRGYCLANNTKLDWARTIHESIPELIINTMESQTDIERNSKILFTGGCSQNVLWNTELKKHWPNLVVAPHSADEGLALGALKWLMNKHNVQGQIQNFPYAQRDEVPPDEPTDETIENTAWLLAEGKIVGWYQGHGEIGPRALGNRSILMHPGIHNGKDKINERVKNRENYRPFGCTILKEYQDEWIDLPFDSPHMMFVGKMKTPVLAVCHIDDTTRHQTLGNENPIFRKLIEKFHELTGYPLLLNTSLNVNGRPIAGSFEDAYEVLQNTDLDYLIYGNTEMRK